MTRRVIIPVIILLAIVFLVIRACAIAIEKNEETESPSPDIRDYQIAISSDSIYLFDNQRFIGAIPIDTSKLDSLILNDNK